VICEVCIRRIDCIIVYYYNKNPNTKSDTFFACSDM
jgi:hypothetical protein